MKKCPNCKKELERVDSNAFHCGECKEIFVLTDGKLTPVKDKQNFFEKLSEKLNGFSKRVKDIAGGFGLKESEDEDGFFWGDGD